MNRFTVMEPTELLKFLFVQLPERSRSSVKSLLANRMILVNDETITQFNHPLTAGQHVEIRGAGKTGHSRGRELNILFEDAHLVVIDKRAGLLSIATDSEKENTAYSLLSEHVKRAHPRNRIFIVHRLDRDTSGLMMFAKNQAVQRTLQDAWQEAVLERIYVAVAEGRIQPPTGTHVSWLTEDKSLIMHSSPTPNDGQKAVTRYRTLQATKLYSLVELSLETGRKNQIRVHMQDLKHCIVGDKKYGSTRNPLRRLGLHAHVLAFNHPVTTKALRFESRVPEEFLRLFG